MYFLDNNSGIATMPPLKETQSTTPLWFTEGDGHKGISWPGEDWFNIQQAEQLALLDAAGIRPDKGKLNQLTLAIRAIIGQEALLKTQALAEIAAAGKGAQEKARTHLGLGKLATQDGIQEATVHRKGIVQLNSSPRSEDDTTAATPKAVNERVNAVVDKAPSDLDTLNKLAQAISNNPKFAESVMQLLSQKLAKNENGADIPDKNQFIKNLGLLETVNLAKNATPNQRKINGKTLTQDVQLTATDVHAVTPEVLRVEIPVGIPLPWPAERAPTGWFICNGEPFDKKKYPLLALAYPSGKLPDLRGEFIRGWDAGRGVNPRRKVLSSETASLESHAHGYRDRYYVEDDGPLGHANNKEKMPVGYNADTGSRATDGDNDSFLFIDKTTSNAGGSETRPRNVAFNYIVRAA
ncbi:tail fiber protein [Arsenophonus sp. PmNCSU2021_1]|uniref:tail fiber protein n=1 Tax=Arsenophonus sp. PmNCSU2021_1 TaxID=3118989 RepID=UPI002FF13BFC